MSWVTPFGGPGVAGACLESVDGGVEGTRTFEPLDANCRADGSMVRSGAQRPSRAALRRMERLNTQAGHPSRLCRDPGLLADRVIGVEPATDRLAHHDGAGHPQTP